MYLSRNKARKSILDKPVRRLKLAESSFAQKKAIDNPLNSKTKKMAKLAEQLKEKIAVAQ